MFLATEAQDAPDYLGVDQQLARGWASLENSLQPVSNLRHDVTRLMMDGRLTVLLHHLEQLLPGGQDLIIVTRADTGPGT